MITIWHNPRCSKSRETLALLREKTDEQILERLYLEDAPSAVDIRVTLAMLGVPAFSMMRPKEALFKELGLSRETPEEELVAAMAAHPKLIERPIVFKGKRAAIGRPPEKVLELL